MSQPEWPYTEEQIEEGLRAADGFAGAPSFLITGGTLWLAAALRQVRANRDYWKDWADLWRVRFEEVKVERDAWKQQAGEAENQGRAPMGTETG